MVRIENVSKTYRRGSVAVRALAGVTLDVPRGEFVSIMGPSGSGKSTLLHLVGGVDVPDAGEVHVADRCLGGLSDDARSVFRRRHVGFVFQSFNLLPMLTAEENVALPLLLDGKRMREVRPRVERMLDQVGLRDRRQHLPQALSGGEMQRVAIARALVVEPAVLLADEPTGNLDSQTGEDVLALIRDTARRLEQTVLMVTHDVRAAAYGSRVVTLRDGAIADEPPDRERSAGLWGVAIEANGR